MLLLPAILMLAGCGSSLKVVKTTSQDWHGGAAGSGSGTNYRVEIKKPADARLKVEKVWLGDALEGHLLNFGFEPPVADEADPHIAKEGHNICFLSFAAKKPSAASNNGQAQELENVAAPADLPEGFEKGIVIWYRLNDENGRWVITSVESLQPQYYP